MKTRMFFASALTAITLLGATGCAVTRGQETVGAFVDDTRITTVIKARFAESNLVSATSMSVETLNGPVLLSGFAKNPTEKSEADRIARATNGVRSVRNEIVVRP